ncbi:uncharacterized protein LOC131236799 isoform X2 [Magnolia sinica]|uniref:uncharacterized protein LOC131236799 isoform X2 n=1 Tax=Magnolia sinica TaxID=86752 RepID=UPI002658C11A|nr:uncharacterized protein LOC131236799 isoform X2 [Magnolia sinica]
MLFEMAASADEGESEAEVRLTFGSYLPPVRFVNDSAEEILLLWAIQQPTLSKQNSFVRHSSLRLDIEACGRRLTISQSPSSMSTPGVTGAVMWDSGVVLGKFLEHAVDSRMLVLHGKKLLKKNIETNIEGNARGSAMVTELEWGDEPDCELIDPLPDFVLGSDVIYSEGAVTDLLVTLRQLSGAHTTIFLAGELRNDVVLECFLEEAMKEFVVGHVDQAQWHPDYCSHRVAMFVLVKKSQKRGLRE